MTHDGLPPGWTTKPLGAIAQINPPPDRTIAPDMPVSFVPMAAVEAGSGRLDVSATRPYEDVRRGFRPFAEHDVLLAKITPSMENGKVAVARGLAAGLGIGSTEFHVLRPADEVLPEYLFFFLLRDEFRRGARRHMTGTAGQLRVPTSYLKEVPVPLAPPGHQNTIVEEIEKQFTRLDAAVAALRRVQANLKRYRAAVLQSLFAAETLGPVRIATGEELFSYITSGSRGWARFYVSDGPLFIRIGNLRRGSITLDLGDVTHVCPPAGAEGERTRVQPGDLLISITADLGRVARAPNDGLPEMYVNQHIALARPAEGIDGRFVAWFMASRRGQAELQSMRRGATKAGLGLDDIRAVTVPIPLQVDPLTVVAEVERQMTLADGVEGSLRASLRHSEAERQAILSRAFSGALTRGRRLPTTA